jgi:hypothetical protein
MDSLRAYTSSGGCRYGILETGLVSYAATNFQAVQLNSSCICCPMVLRPYSAAAELLHSLCSLTCGACWHAAASLHSSRYKCVPLATYVFFLC